MNKVIIPADKKYRNKMLRYLFFGLIAGGLVAGLFMPGLLETASKSGDKAKMIFHVMFAGLMVLFLMLFPLGLYLLALGKLTIATERFPPPGIRVIRDTVLIQGEEAIRRGRITVFSSFMLMGLALWGIYRVYQLAHLIFT